METTIRKKKKTTDISLHLLKKKIELLNMNVDQSVPVDQIPDISTSPVSNSWAKLRRISRETFSAARSKEKTAVFAGFVKHAKEPQNANAREVPVK